MRDMVVEATRAATMAAPEAGFRVLDTAERYPTETDLASSPAQASPDGPGPAGAGAGRAGRDVPRLRRDPAGDRAGPRRRAEEYVACQGDHDPGVLILGEFAGAAAELSTAYPFTIAVMVVVQMLYVEDHLGNRANVPGEAGAKGEA